MRKKPIDQYALDRYTGAHRGVARRAHFFFQRLQLGPINGIRQEALVAPLELPF